MSYVFVLLVVVIIDVMLSILFVIFSYRIEQEEKESVDDSELSSESDS